MIPWLDRSTPFPPLAAALAEPNGLLAAGADLSPARLQDAYSHGIFPWSAEGEPLLWWSPDPRMVLYVGELRIRRSLARALAARRFEIRVDTAFREVIGRCARVPRRGQGGTWITSAMVDAYAQLAERGLAHSVEAWRDGELVGGLYGVALGRMFFGESMFAEATDASKVALAHLVAILRCGGYPMIDCQQDTPHLASLGARPIARAQFAAELAALVHCPAPAGIWCPPPLEDVVP